MEHLIAILAALAALVCSIHAILRRRDPKAALWWVGVSWVFPLMGPILYWFFGINRLERKATRLRQTSKTDPFSLVKGNQVTPYLNKDQACSEMLDAIRAARHSIGLATYIFTNDVVGQRFIEALIEAAKKGVQIRVLIDDVGSGFSWKNIDQELHHHRIPVAYFLPTLVPWRWSYLNLRNHRKILTVDGRIGFTGSMNIQSTEICQDTHFRLEGPIVAQMQHVFRADWYFTTGEILKGSAWFPALKEKGTVLARGTADGPDENFEKCRWIILGAIARAKKSVRIITPYFIPDLSLITTLNLAAMSGVQVDLVLPVASDLKVVQWASQAWLWQILERGCRVWKSPPPFDHGKLMIVDGNWVLFGSTNMDQRSLRLNFEFNVECFDKNLARSLERHIDDKINVSHRVTLEEVDRRRFSIKLRDGLARLFSPLL